MARINIAKPTGNVENLELLTAFKADDATYIIFDSGKIGSMGLPIIYVCKYAGEKLEKISDPNEWQTAKNYLKGIINGTNFEYIKVDANLNADEAYFMPLTLPQASFDLIKSRYVVKEDNGTSTTITDNNVAQNQSNESTLETLGNTMPNLVINNEGTTPNVFTPVEPVNNVSTPQPEVNITPNIAPETPIMPNNNVVSNNELNVSSAANESTLQEAILNSAPIPEPVVNNTPVEDIKIVDNSFEKDKEVFLKACENMFDALVSKYQKKLTDLDQREQIIAQKEKEIEAKLHNASEHLANAAAREQVANIAHDNAQRVMDISNLMPQNPSNNTTDVI